MTTLVLKMVTNVNLQALFNPLQNTLPTSARRTTLIDPATITCFNCGKDGYFTLSCPELKDIGNIKEIEKEEKETSNKSEKKEP